MTQSEMVTAQRLVGVLILELNGAPVAVGSGQIGVRRAQDMLCGSCQRAGSRHRLVYLMGEGGRHPAHEINARCLRRFRFLFPQQRLNFADRTVCILTRRDAPAPNVPR